MIYGGNISPDYDRVGVYEYQNSSNVQGGQIPNYALPLNEEKTFILSHKNGVVSITVDDKSYSFTNTNVTDRQYIRTDISRTSIKELLIKPL